MSHQPPMPPMPPTNNTAPAGPPAPPAPPFQHPQNAANLNAPSHQGQAAAPTHGIPTPPPMPGQQYAPPAPPQQFTQPHYAAQPQQFAQPQAGQTVTASFQAPRQEKSILVAYLLWFFLGQLGVHKFYLNKNGMGAVYLLLGIIGWATIAIFIGWLFLIPLWCFLIYDLITMPAQVLFGNRMQTHTVQIQQH